MHRLVLLMFVSVTICDYLTRPDFWGRGGWLPSEVGYLPELTSLAALLAVVAVGVQDRFAYVRSAYWILLGAMTVTLLFGAVANSSEPGEIFTGVRFFARAVPFFLLPFVARFSDEQVGTQIKTLMWVAVLQVPLAIEQRITTMTRGRPYATANISGDYTTGTLMDSGILSIFLVCCLCVCAAFYIHRAISKWQFIGLAALLFLPTTINETKATLFLLPAGLVLTFYAGARPGKRAQMVAWLATILVTGGALFWASYDYLNRSEATGRERTLSGWVVDEEKREKLFIREQELGGEENAGRWDAVTVPLAYVADDPVRLMFGLGIGSISKSALGSDFAGRYWEIFDPFKRSTFPRMLLETGFLGLAVSGMLFLLVFADSFAVLKSGTPIMRTVALGWIGVCGVMSLAFFYKDIVINVPISYLFAYFSGLIAADRMRVAVSRRGIGWPEQGRSSPPSTPGRRVVESA